MILGSRDRPGRQGRLDRRDRLGLRAIRDRRGSRDRKVIPESRDRQESRVRQDRQDHWLTRQCRQISMPALRPKPISPKTVRLENMRRRPKSLRL